MSDLPHNPRPDNPKLSAKEAVLIAAFRRLTRQQQASLLEAAEALANYPG
ncbi:hypothetical protein SAMN05216198_2062 [Halopseudomonas litoralis]|uniref:Uncharacterized protein n=1 Tax=Halopseudomonas litoralis TaxID=797277 RepID=A0A1H1SM03_9GAMM|nr:hypothetical protein [Halopseudomonas litoralis]SDS48756.1 hypothetical protein SAMN05216198_2062 [Halopseudomonas litoralis]